MLQWIACIALLITLVLIATEDFKNRRVSVLYFPLLFSLSVLYTLSRVSFDQVLLNVGLVLGFLIIQLFLMGLYFMIKHRAWVNLTDQYIGWGDVLFLCVIIPLFSPMGYILFYIASLLLTIIGILMYQWCYKRVESIPLAGLQSLCLGVFILCHQWRTNVLYIEDFSYLMGVH